MLVAGLSTHALGAGGVGHDGGLAARVLGGHASLDLDAGERGGGSHESSHFDKWSLVAKSFAVYGCGIWRWRCGESGVFFTSALSGQSKTRYEKDGKRGQAALREPRWANRDWLNRTIQSVLIRAGIRKRKNNMQGINRCFFCLEWHINRV